MARKARLESYGDELREKFTDAPMMAEKRTAESVLQKLKMLQTPGVSASVTAGMQEDSDG